MSGLPENDDDLLSDESSSAPANHSGYFRREQEALEKELQEILKARGGVLQDTPGFVPGRYEFLAIRCASWASHEDLRLIGRKIVMATLRAGQRLVDANNKGTAELVRFQRHVAWASWAIAGATFVAAFAAIWAASQAGKG